MVEKQLKKVDNLDRENLLQYNTLQFYGKENGCKACGKNCALCSHIIESTSFKDNEGNTYNIQGSINCKTVGVISEQNEFALKMRTTVFAGQKLKHSYVKEDIQMTWWKNN
jgi:hypothetical protein